MLQVEINPFGKAPRQASNIVGGGKELTKTTASKKTGNPTEIISTVVNIQNIYIYFSKRYQLRFHEKYYHMLSSW